MLSFAEGQIDEDALVGCGVVEVEDVEKSEYIEKDLKIETETIYDKSIDRDQTENVSVKPTVIKNEHPRVEMDEESAVITKAEQNKFQGYQSASVGQAVRRIEEQQTRDQEETRRHRGERWVMREGQSFHSSLPPRMNK